MAEYAPSTSAVETRKIWNKVLRLEADQSSVYRYLIGTDKDSFIQKLKDTASEAGDQVHTFLYGRLTGAGQMGDGVLKGNEESISPFRDTLAIDQLRHAGKFKAGISEQRVTFDIKQTYQSLASRWLGERMSVACLNQLAGNTLETNLRYTGLNAVVAPDSGHTLVIGPGNEGGLTSSHPFTLQHIDAAESRASTYQDATGVPIRPGKVRFPGGINDEAYVCIIHPYQWYSIKNTASVIGWPELIKAFYQGSKDKNPMMSSGMGLTQVRGKYSNTWIITDPRIPSGIFSGAAVANTRRAVFLGAQAGVIAYGTKDRESEVEMIEDLDDYGKLHGIGVDTIVGVKKSVYNSLDFGTITIPTYAANPA